MDYLFYIIIAYFTFGLFWIVFEFIKIKKGK